MAVLGAYQRRRALRGIFRRRQPASCLFRRRRNRRLAMPRCLRSRPAHGDCRAGQRQQQRSASSRWRELCWRDQRRWAFCCVHVRRQQPCTPGRHLSHVFLRDRSTGITELISVSSAEVAGNASSFGASMTRNGRFVTSSSSANNLVAGDTGAVDVFVRDRFNHTTERVSVSTDGNEGGGGSFGSDISSNANGRFVVFV